VAWLLLLLLLLLRSGHGRFVPLCWLQEAVLALCRWQHRRTKWRVLRAARVAAFAAAGAERDDRKCACTSLAAAAASHPGERRGAIDLLLLGPHRPPEWLPTGAGNDLHRRQLGVILAFNAVGFDILGCGGGIARERAGGPNGT
jgi:hypothetical protein